MVYSLNKTLSCNIVVGGIVLPYNPSFGKLSGGVCDRTGKFIENTALHEKYYDGSYPYNKSNVKLKQKKAIYLGTWCGIYGHAITDNLKKIWFLESEEFKNLLKKDNPDLVYNYLGGGKIANCVIDIFKALGYDIKKDFVRICNLVQYDEVYIPEDSIQIMDNGRFYAEEYKAIINRIINNCQIEESCFNKIYLTRCGINDGKDYGEKAIENVFKENGYNIISPEKHIFKEQVAIMQSCNKLAATEGSISHNSLFAKDGVEVILLKKANFNNSYQRMINDMKKHKVTYISAHHTIRNRIPWAGPFFLWKTKDFNDYFNINGKYNRWFSVLWYRYVLQSLNYNLIKPIFHKLKFITCSIFKYTERYIKK